MSPDTVRNIEAVSAHAQTERQERDLVTVADALYTYRSARAHRLGVPVHAPTLWDACLREARRPA